MRREWNILILVALTAAVAGSLWLARRDQLPSKEAGNETPHQAGMQDSLSEPAETYADVDSTQSFSEPELDAEDAAADCTRVASLQAEPALAAEFALFDSLVTSGPTIESYRDLSPAALAGLADQGDSAAMAVLGAISVMSAMNLREDRAVDYLLLEGPELPVFDFKKPLKPEITEHLEAASDWFYMAAVHGRLLALQNVGEITAIIGGSPMDLGWIDSDQYELLESFEKLALDPANVYGALTFEIAPELRSGPLGTMLSDLVPGGERSRPILEELAQQFTRDRAAANLPPLDVPASSTLSADEIRAMLYCDP